MDLKLRCFLQSCPNLPALFRAIVNTKFKNHVYFYTVRSKSEESRFAGCASVWRYANYSYNWKISQTRLHQLYSCTIFLIRNRLAFQFQLDFPVILVWIPGLARIPRNEVADMAAKTATVNVSIPDIALPPSDFCNAFRDKLNKSSQECN